VQQRNAADHRKQHGNDNDDHFRAGDMLLPFLLRDSPLT
jgi:hypothetical protein